ncbi:helicase HerA domain-containing protein [Caminibacter pacificus]
MKEIYEKMGLFYLGKDAEDDSLTLYKSKHLTTHAIIIGMTGSGKTGLGIDLIEEAAIDNIPVLVIDPKGDMGNLCLAFPEMKPEDFKPWIDESTAQAKGMSVDELAEKTAKMWKEGIESFHQDLDRVKRYAEVDKTIYTPGSTAGVSVNILGSFEAPGEEVVDDVDLFASLINSSVSSILSLIGIDADPVSSKEHLLISNIFYYFWSKGQSLSLEELIGYITNPPFEKIGVMPLKTFYPQKERLELAMKFNNVLSSVGFSTWISGEPLDIGKMLYDKNGKAKIAIFSIAHLSDNERMFFVTLLLNRFISWMRRQRGSFSLKAMLYMDEIFGYFPPSKNPPSKEPMLLLLKQARAFGIGVVLSTQNPVDIDYKGLSNIGTWFVGKLQTKQDIEKVVDSLSDGEDKKEVAEKIANLKGRHFYLKNVHEDDVREFYTRWVLSYLKGPMTKDDIRRLMKDKKTEVQETPAVIETSDSDGGMKPIVSKKIKEYFNDTNINSDDPFYPYIYANAKVRFYNQKRGIDFEEEFDYKLELYEGMNTIDWEEAVEERPTNLSRKYKSSAKFAKLPEIVENASSLKEFERKLKDYLYHNKKIELFACKKLKMESKLGESEEDFRARVDGVLKDKKEVEIEKIEKKYKTKFKRLQDKLQRLEIKLEKEKSDVSSKTTDTLLDIGMGILGALFGRKSSAVTKGASALKKGGRIVKEKRDVEAVEMQIEEVKEDIKNLKEELEAEIEKIEEKYDPSNYEIEPVSIKPRRSDVSVEDIALLWEK